MAENTLSFTRTGKLTERLPYVSWVCAVPRLRVSCMIVVGAAIALVSPNALAQTAPFKEFKQDYPLDSGPIALSDDAPAGPVLAYSDVIAVPGATWLRLLFDTADLAIDPKTGNSAILRITSLADGGVQLLNDETIAQWDFSTAYFNGNAVLLELLTYAGANPSHIEISTVFYGLPSSDTTLDICNNQDDRQTSHDPRVARIMPVGCTAFLFDGASHCMITAGHCTGDIPNQFVPGRMHRVQFNVPASNPDGSINHPPPQDQYAIDPNSIQFGFTGVGDDWCVFGVYANPITGLSPLAAQGASFPLASNVPSADGTPLRITGYGATSPPGDLSFTQQTDSGPFAVLGANIIEYDEIDTMGGNSGSPILHEDSGQVIGIHTHGGCSDPADGYNRGQRIDHAALQAALANPIGVCAEPPGTCLFPPWCCQLVCQHEPSCCTNWDSTCDALAVQICPNQPVWTIGSHFGEAYAEAQAWEPDLSDFDWVFHGPVLGFDPASLMLEAWAHRGFAHALSPSIGTGVGRVRIEGVGTPLLTIRWKIISRGFWRNPNPAIHPAENFGIGDALAIIGLEIDNVPAGPVDIHYGHRFYSYNNVKHELHPFAQEDLPSYVIKTTYRINGDPIVGPPGGANFDLDNVLGLLVQDWTTSSFTVQSTDTVLVELEASSESTIKEPGNDIGISNGDSTHTGFVGTVVLSLAGPGALPGGAPSAAPQPQCYSAQPCCEPGPAPRCDNSLCCQAVCAIDPQCCLLEWDDLCALEATRHPVCNCSVVSNDLCVNAEPLAAGVQFTTVDAHSDGPPSPCGFTGQPWQDSDVWFEYTPTCSQLFTVTLFPVPMGTDQGDRILAVYEGGCPGAGGVEIACGIISPGDVATSIDVLASGGVQYLVRVGAPAGIQGQSILDLTHIDCPADLIGPFGAPDGVVDVFDLIELINQWGSGSSCADLSGPNGVPDGTIDVFDLIELINNWGPCP